MNVPKHISVYDLNGPMFFALSSRISMIKAKDFTRCIILRMRAVPAIDTDAIRQFEKLVEKCAKKGVTVIFSHTNEQPMRAMKKSGLYDKIGEENFCENIDTAMDRAMNI